MERRDSLKLVGILFVWLFGHVLIPVAAVVYPITKAVRSVRTFIRFSYAGIHLLLIGLLIGLLTRLSRLSPERKKAAEAEKKFAFVSHVLPPEWSGQAVAIKRLLEGVDASDYCLISSQDYASGLHGDFIGRLPGTYYWLPVEWQMRSRTNYSIVRWVNWSLAILARGFRIACMLFASGCRTVIAASGDPIDLPAAYVAACVTGARFVPYLFDDFTYQWPLDDGRKEARLAESIIFQKSSRVIVPNEFLQREIHRRHPRVRTAIVRNPTGASAVTENPAYSRDRRQNTPRIITYTGAIYHVNFKAFQNLIVAIDREGMPPIELHLYAAQDKTWLEDRGVCSPRIVLHGHVPSEEVGRVQGLADILFLAFAFDSAIPELVTTSAPGKLGDYLATGVPILAHVPGDCFVAWYLNEYKCGVVVDEDSPEALAHGIQSLLTDTALRSGLRENALNRARADFDPSATQRAFLSAIRASK
ncbi:MAG TPA: glycosyltransferase [Syntrophorhabdales bacterium]|nr:glycosyltransferase [Syntrophorhabdales bacterium]